MRVVSWNINGIRSFKTPINRILSSLDANILCFQETKISRNQVDDSTAIVDDYLSFFAFPKYLSGYSGVATYCNNLFRPFVAQDCFLLNGCDSIVGLFDLPDTFNQNELKDLDSEGRVLITGHQFETKDGEIRNLFIFNLYCPHNDPDRPERSVYKLNFHRLLEKIVHHILSADKFNHVLIIGDINISPQRIDHCDPSDDFELSPHRQWLQDFLSSNTFDEQKSPTHFVDIFRERHPKARNAFTCWNTKNSARKTNFGTRIDLALCDKNLYPFVTDFEILTHIEGSDHCPIRVVFDEIKAIPGQTIPKICAKLWPELGSGKRQITIKRYLQKPSQIPQDEELPTQRNNVMKPNKKTKQITNSISRYFKSNGTKNHSIDECNTSDLKADQPTLSQITVDTKADIFVINGETNGDLHLDNEVEKKDNDAAKIWKTILSGKKAAPLCSTHKEPCILLTVNKPGPNKGRKFYACSRPAGFKNDPASSCEFFKWYKN